VGSQISGMALCMAALGRADSSRQPGPHASEGRKAGISTFVYDVTVLLAAGHSERRTGAQHKARLEFGAIPRMPAPVDAHGAGRLLATAKRKDVVDAVVVSV
jgi:hypothetical protein